MTFGVPSAFGMKVALSDPSTVSGVHELESVSQDISVQLRGWQARLVFESGDV